MRVACLCPYIRMNFVNSARPWAELMPRWVSEARMIGRMWPSARKAPQRARQYLPDAFPVETATQLLAPFEPLIRSMRAEVGLPPSHWQQIYDPVLCHYAELCQRLPASEAHHHADTGGLLRHGLETLSEALKLRRRQLLPPGAPANKISGPMQSPPESCSTTSGNRSPISS